MTPAVEVAPAPPAPGAERGWVFNLQRFSVHDGPGIRTTVFLKGCPLCCPWCHNPESRSPTPEVAFLEERCLVCGACRVACPLAASAAGNGPLPAQVEDCTRCGACVEACPTDARQIVGRAMTAVEVVAEVARDRAFYEEGGGGVTFSGGEPLAQPRFLGALLRVSRAQGLHTTLDTCGFAPRATLLELAGLADLVLFDVKLTDAARHELYTGVPCAPILDNLRALAQVHAQLWLRLPLVPGVNDDDAHLEAVIQLARSLPAVRRVCVLPYHSSAALKHRRFGPPRPEFPATWTPPAPELAARTVARLQAAGLTASLGG